MRIIFSPCIKENEYLIWGEGYDIPIDYFHSPSHFCLCHTSICSFFSSFICLLIWVWLIHFAGRTLSLLLASFAALPALSLLSTLLYPNIHRINMLYTWWTSCHAFSWICIFHAGLVLLSQLCKFFIFFYESRNILIINGAEFDQFFALRSLVFPKYITCEHQISLYFSSNLYFVLAFLSLYYSFLIEEQLE